MELWKQLLSEGFLPRVTRSQYYITKQQGTQIIKCSPNVPPSQISQQWSGCREGGIPCGLDSMLPLGVSDIP